MRTQWAVNPSVALQEVSALVRKVGKGASDALRSTYYPTGYMCVSSAGYLTRICDILMALPARVTDRWKQWRLAHVKAFSLTREKSSVPERKKGHGSTLWCDSFTIWRYLCRFPLGIWCQLHQDDACSGHLRVSLRDFCCESHIGNIVYR